jgi:hypothetical protein
MMRRRSFAKRRKACNTTAALSRFGYIIARYQVDAMRTACVIGLIPISLVLAPLSYAQYGGGHMAAGSPAEVLFLPDILQFGFVRASFAKSMMVAPIT